MQSALTSVPVPALRVRLRCDICDVAWTHVETGSGDDADSHDNTSDGTNCWCCGLEGSTLRSAMALREDEHLHLDFD